MVGCTMVCSFLSNVGVHAIVPSNESVMLTELIQDY